MAVSVFATALTGASSAFAQKANPPQQEGTAAADVKVSQSNAAPVPQGQLGPVIAEGRDPETHEKIQVRAQPSSDEAVRATSPKNLAANRDGFFTRVGRKAAKGAEKFALGTVQTITDTPSRAKHVVLKEFPMESVFFYMALGISASIQLSTDFAKDPAALQHFIDQNITDPVAHISFLGFMIANRTMAAFLMNIGAVYNPNDPQNRLSGRGPTRFQRGFAPLVGPLGLSAGFMASSIMHEIIVDPDIWTCARGKILKVKPEKQAEYLEICERAHENWALKKKVMDYAPDLGAMIATSVIQAYLVNKGVFKAAGLVGRVVVAGAERYVPVLLTGVAIGRAAGQVLAPPPIKIAMRTVSGILIFVEINHPLTHFFKLLWETPRQGKDITASINNIYNLIGLVEKNNWQPVMEPKRTDCEDHFDYSELGLPGMPEKCPEPKMIDVPKLLKKHAEKQNTWRTFLLQAAYGSHSSWKEYVIKFQTLYTNSYRFYNSLIESISWQKFEGPQAGRLNELYSAPVDQKKLEGMRAAAEYLRELLNLPEDQRPPGLDEKVRKDLGTIHDGLIAADPSARVLKVESTLQMNGLSSRSGEKKNKAAFYDALVRQQMTEEAIRLLDRYLNKQYDRFWDKGLVDVKHPAYKKLGESLGNPFMIVKYLVGDLKEIKAGLAHLAKLNNDETVINQEFKDINPGMVGLSARTPRMVDFLLGSMVCGPVADPRTEVKVKALNGLLGSITEFFSGKPKSSDSFEMAEINKAYMEKVQAPGPNLFKNRRESTLVPEIIGFHATFRPPRIVQDMPFQVCDAPAPNIPGDRVYTIHEGRWSSPNDGYDYHGFLDIVKDRIRPDLLGSESAATATAFSKWWETNVEPAANKTVAAFNEEYTKIVEHYFMPAFGRFGTELTTDYNGRKFQATVDNSILDEVDFYLTVIGKAHLSKFSKDQAALEKNKAEYAAEAAKIKRLYFLLVSQFSTPPDMPHDPGVKGRLENWLKATLHGVRERKKQSKDDYNALPAEIARLYAEFEASKKTANPAVSKTDDVFSQLNSLFENDPRDKKPSADDKSGKAVGGKTEIEKIKEMIDAKLASLSARIGVDERKSPTAEKALTAGGLKPATMLVSVKILRGLVTESASYEGVIKSITTKGWE